MKKLIALALIISCGPVQAIPVEWTLTNVFFEGGAQANGSFTFDADTSIFSDINIVTPADGLFSDSYSYELGVSSSNMLVVVGQASGITIQSVGGGDLTGESVWAINFNDALTNEGGYINLFGSPEGDCFDAGCSSISGSQRFIYTGMVSGVIQTIPLPGAVWLMGPALGLLGFRGRRRKQLLNSSKKKSVTNRKSVLSRLLGALTLASLLMMLAATANADVVIHKVQAEPANAPTKLVVWG